MDASTPSPEGGGLFGWVARKPKLAFFVIAGVALVIGIGLGAAAGVSQSQLDDANTKARDAERKLAQVSRERDELQADREELQGDLASATDRADTSEAAIKKLTAKADVPDFTGDTVADARGNDRVDSLGWKIRTVTRETSSASPGTVLSQKPAEGRTLGSGRSITLTVAKKPPPKPKQWVTVTTLQGDSSTKTEEFTVPRGAKARLVYSMPGDTNNAIILYKAPKEYIDLLLNEIGPQQGTTRLYEPGHFYLDVTGSYTIQIQVFKRPA